MDVSQFSLEGKVALVTGGSRGIGEATAIAFAEAGADVAVTSRKQADLEKVAEKVEKLGRKSLAIAAHVGRIDQIQPLVDKVTDKFGRIDILVNNAGTSLYMPAIEMSEKAWDSVMNLNLKGLFFLSQAVAQVMKKNNGGQIINISSTSGFRVLVPAAHYSISKAAVIMATKAMAIEWAPYNIRANCIAPGPIQTGLLDAVFTGSSEEEVKKQKETLAAAVPLKRAGQPKELADSVLFLASDASSFVTGQTLAVDGGVLLV
ncbi:MAG: SDR family oxidoreductase [Deltaproteobacteria bacterium]|jgi:NAD(P)-dependent dehydrogenase (short-subunit alcohol dehydrogenase family)|nr:SDR family oxidoreductase [Deltaproteobacteria bacterium]MBT4639388.1 SDR family oxidoreductase [Deltaproteobacteria bacterium]MBT6611108.1 SDR family oxidoreductase [Deltaproteobacteria bacterium]MBT7154043.1 SDR family oxidoreductase [Deltaproteobacteria bacterium]MBT7714821.1 SDR family oxidoreductase [Deltaproteobacteria bacterium]